MEKMMKEEEKVKIIWFVKVYMSTYTRYESAKIER